MSQAPRYTLTVLLALLVCCCAAQPVSAQSRSLRIRRLEYDDVKAPVYNSNYSGGSSSPKWMEISCEYDTLPDWIDRLDFRYFVMVEHKTTKERKLFTAEVSYLDVAQGAKHVSTMFLRPSTIARYGECKGVAVEIRYQGRLVAEEADPRPRRQQRWWLGPQPVTGYLLNRAQTPFAFIQVNEHETIDVSSGLR